MSVTRPLLCATVTGGTTDELRLNRDRVAGADLIELRLDFVNRPDVSGALADRRLPVVVTCRPQWEGGCFSGSEEERHKILEAAVVGGAEYVDVEWQAGFDDLIGLHRGQGIVVSHHNFSRVPNDIGKRYRAMRSTGAEVVKMATAVNCLSDGLRLASLGKNATDERKVVVGMGVAGIPSRLLPGRYGSCWTYAGEGVAPGQIGLDRMRDEYRFRSIGESTAIYGVLGRPVGHSLSPAMHNAGFAAYGIDAIYLPLEAKDLADFTAFSRAVPLAGVSVTAPFKERVLESLVEVDEIGRRVGAVNTLCLGAAGWAGVNTDVHGFLEPIRDRMNWVGTRATVLGAGGAARAVAVALEGVCADVSICARDEAKAQNVAEAIGVRSTSFPPLRKSWDMLVNTTPVGTFPDIEATPLPDESFGGHIVYDLIYNPRITRLMAGAKRAGCEAIGGLPMLVSQAVRQFDLWTGIKPSSDLFHEAAERELLRQSTVGNQDS